jgi:hypothetical protein
LWAVYILKLLLGLYTGLNHGAKLPHSSKSTAGCCSGGGERGSGTGTQEPSPSPPSPTGTQSIPNESPWGTICSHPRPLIGEFPAGNRGSGLRCHLYFCCAPAPRTDTHVRRGPFLVPTRVRSPSSDATPLATCYLHCSPVTDTCLFVPSPPGFQCILLCNKLQYKW